MGGPGSGRHDHWWRPDKKSVVVSCRHLDVNEWVRGGVLKANLWLAGSCRWTHPSGSGFTVNFEVDTLNPASLRHLAPYNSAVERTPRRGAPAGW